MKLIRTKPKNQIVIVDQEEFDKIENLSKLGSASPIEQTKHQSDHKVFSFQKYFLNVMSYKCHKYT